MKEQDGKLKWVPLNKLFSKAIYIGEILNNYAVVHLSNNHRIILDRRDSNVLVSYEKKYFLPSNWRSWLKRGFLVVALYKRSDKKSYYIFKAQDKKLVASGVGVEADSFFRRKDKLF
ncbi:hypothetical protein [Caldisericum sp. AR60]|uniref:hypothetical protein n=1 Tax=Caldisericum sp. AR60 TaxID=3397852 RepID=UPI0039FC8057